MGVCGCVCVWVGVGVWVCVCELAKYSNALEERISVHRGVCCETKQVTIKL